MTPQDEFAAGLLQQVCPPGLCTWNGSDPAQRYAVYRNNVTMSLIEALADTFPVTRAMVGEEFFRSMAHLFVHAQPPNSPLLVFYGEHFPDFIQGFDPAAGLPYLADLARLEMHYVKSYHAAEVTPLALYELASLLSDENALPGVHFTLHPSLHLIRSRYPVVSLWAAHQDAAPASRLGSIDLNSHEAAIVIRQGLDVEVIPIELGAAQFIDNLHNHFSFAAAANTATAFNLGAALELLLRCTAITHFTLQE